MTYLVIKRENVRQGFDSIGKICYHCDANDNDYHFRIGGEYIGVPANSSIVQIL